MRKFLGITLLGVIIIAFLSCEKDEMEDLNQTPEMDATTKRIVDFKNELSKKNTTGESMHIDSLVWYSEATLNFSYGHPYLNYTNKTTDSIRIMVDLTENLLVSYEDVVNTHIKFNNFVYEQYESFLDHPKHMIVMDIVLLEVNALQAELCLYSKIGKVTEQENLKYVNDPWEYYDWWKAYEYQGGRCNGYGSQYPSTDNAADQLELHMDPHNADFRYLSDPDVYYTDIPPTWEYPDAGFDNSPNNDPQTQDLYPTLIYGPEWMRDCLSPDDMFFLLSQMDDLLIHDRDDNYPDKYPHEIEIWAAGPPGDGTRFGEHWYEFKLGDRNFYPHEPDEPALMR